jgi:hypothetical protein
MGGKDKIKYFLLVSGIHLTKLISSFLADKYDFYTVFGMKICLNWVTFYNKL